MALPGSTDFMAQTMTRGAMSPPKSKIELSQTPAMRDTLGELSGLVQGQGMGRMVSQLPDDLIIGRGDVPIDPDEDLHLDPKRWNEIPSATPEEIEEMKPGKNRPAPLPDLPSRRAAGPLRDMRTTDPNMRDLFKDWF